MKTNIFLDGKGSFDFHLAKAGAPLSPSPRNTSGSHTPTARPKLAHYMKRCTCPATHKARLSKYMKQGLFINYMKDNLVQLSDTSPKRDNMASTGKAGLC